MPVSDRARTSKLPGYHSDNWRKWEFDNALYQKHLEWYLDRIYKCLRSTGAHNVLDVGCGEGIVYRAMRARGYSGAWTGFDASDEAVRLARQLSPDANWRQGSANQIPFPDKSFDLVFSAQVFEHLPNPAPALHECTRVAQRWLLLSVPREPWFRALTWCAIKLKLGQDPGHVNHWRPREFRRFVQAAGQLERLDRTTVYQIAIVRVPNLRGQVST
jgi:SAM-dependent methyltransferase